MTKLTFKSIVETGFKFIFEKITWGDKNKPQTHGNSSAAQTHGYFSAAQTHGYQSIACSTGYKGKAAGKIGGWLVLAEWSENGEILKSVKTFFVDGKKIKEDVFYTLRRGKACRVRG